MYYNNYNRGYGGGYSRAPYRNNFQYSGNYRLSYQRQQFAPKKRSGAKWGMTKTNKPYVQGWRANRQFGLIRYIAGPYKNTHRVTSGSGKEWENWTVKITFADGRSELKSCLYDVASKKVVIKEIGIVLNPNAPNGGYCGRFGQKRR